MAPPHFFDPLFFASEVVFTILAVVFCFAIYFKTRESYQLTKYEGIKYFRSAFLFFGISYVVRFIFSVLMFSSFAFDFFIPRHILGPFFIIPLGYLSTIAILYLIFSSIWKRFNNKVMLVFGHCIAILLTVASFASRSPDILLLLQSLLLVASVVLVFFAHNEKHKVSHMQVLYLLVLIVWLLNLWVVGQMRPFPYEPLFQLFSLVVYALIYHKVSKRIR